MGISVNAQYNEDSSEYIKAVKEMSRILIIRTTSPFKRFHGLYRFSFDYQREKKAVKFLHEMTESVIKKRREVVNNNDVVINKKDNSIDEDLGIKKRVAFLDMLLDCTIDGKKLSNLDIREEVDTFMFEV